MIKRIDHVALAVRDHEAAEKFFTEILGAIPGPGAEEPSMKYLWRGYLLGDLSRFEILSPTGKGSFLDGFLKNRNGGIHHVTVQCEDIYETMRFLDEKNIPYFDFHDYSNWKELFIHPKNAFGLLVQIAEFNSEDWIHESAVLQKKFKVTKNKRSTSVSIKHPGGGIVTIELSDEEKNALIKELQK